MAITYIHSKNKSIILTYCGLPQLHWHINSIIVLVIQLITDTIIMSNLPVYEIQLLHEFENTHGISGTCNYACHMITN